MNGIKSIPRGIFTEQLRSAKQSSCTVVSGLPLAVKKIWDQSMSEVLNADILRIVSLSIGQSQLGTKYIGNFSRRRWPLHSTDICLWGEHLEYTYCPALGSSMLQPNFRKTVSLCRLFLPRLTSNPSTTWDARYRWRFCFSKGKTAKE